MPWLIVAIPLLYLILKAVQWTTAARGGYAEAPPDLRASLRRGEPWLFLGTVALLAAIAAYGSWWQHRWASRGLAHATDCIGRLSAADRLPGVFMRFKRTTIADSALGYYALALDQGARLGIARRTIDHGVVTSRQHYAARNDALARSGHGGAIAAQIEIIDRCLRDDWPHDGLLDP